MNFKGINVGPWLKRIIEKNPDVVLLTEVMNFTDPEKVTALEEWLK